jgi:hypothetical protein
MKTIKHNLTQLLNCCSIASLGVLLLAGCKSAPEKTSSAPAASGTSATSTMTTSATSSTMSTTTAAAAPAADKQQALPTIRIKAAGTEAFKDSSGNEWQADHGFADGETVERPDLTITNTADQRIYQSERYSMTKFTQALPNGKYIVKLHFCETFEGITGAGQRVFSFNVGGHEFKDFDVWAKAGGSQRAYVETVPVDVTDGKLEITFTANVENPQINGLEIIPAS